MPQTSVARHNEPLISRLYSHNRLRGKLAQQQILNEIKFVFTPMGFSAGRDFSIGFKIGF